jgi:ribosomal protein S27AE
MKHSLKDGSGYLIIDHTDSPGIRESDIPARLRDSTPIVPAGKKFEADIQFCAHCGSQVILNPNRTRPREYCPKCNHYICDNPICIKTCSPIKKLFDHVDSHLSKSEEPLIQLTDLD